MKTQLIKKKKKERKKKGKNSDDFEDQRRVLCRLEKSRGKSLVAKEVAGRRKENQAPRGIEQPSRGEISCRYCSSKGRWVVPAVDFEVVASVRRSKRQKEIAGTSVGRRGTDWQWTGGVERAGGGKERKTAFLPRVLGNPEVSLCAIG